MSRSTPSTASTPGNSFETSRNLTIGSCAFVSGDDIEFSSLHLCQLVRRIFGVLAAGGGPRVAPAAVARVDVPANPLPAVGHGQYACPRRYPKHPLVDCADGPARATHPVEKSISREHTSRHGPGQYPASRPGDRYARDGL